MIDIPGVCRYVLCSGIVCLLPHYILRSKSRYNLLLSRTLVLFQTSQDASPRVYVMTCLIQCSTVALWLYPLSKAMSFAFVVFVLLISSVFPLSFMLLQKYKK